jgi:glycosyltransferase involved in cell wall biosynthesis
MKSDTRRIYFDITDLMEYGRYNSTLSGIQRVAVMLINRIVNVHGADALHLIAFHPVKKSVVTYASTFFLGDFTYDQTLFCKQFGLAVEEGGGFGRRDLESYINAKYGRGLKAQIHKSRLSLGNRLSHGTTFRRRGIVEYAEPDPAAPTNLLTKQIEHAAKLSPGDIVFVPGATWNFNAYLAFLAESAAKGVEVVQFVHDLIPLVTPEHVVDDVPEQFTEWLETMSKTATRFVANSNATRSDLQRFFRRADLPEKPCAVVRLAHEFTQGPKPKTNWRKPMFLRPELDSSEQIHARVYNAARLPFVLCAGTIESRKNVWTLGRVWISLVEELKDAAPRLVFAGKHGWLKDDFDDLMRGTGNARGFIRIVERPDDHELEYLYKRSLFSVCVSYYEGWGLPIGESLWFGKPVLASNASSMPEVGADLVDYADPNSFDEIRQKALKLIVDDAYRASRAEQIRTAKLRRWSEVADELWSILATGEKAAISHRSEARLGGARESVIND